MSEMIFLLWEKNQGSASQASFISLSVFLCITHVISKQDSSTRRNPLFIRLKCQNVDFFH